MKKKNYHTPEQQRGYANKYREKLKAIVFEHYGYVCNCCGENNPLFLSLDHVNNDGYKEKRNGVANRYLKVIKENFPDTYQILCMNCNHGKMRNNGICPHSLL